MTTFKPKPIKFKETTIADAAIYGIEKISNILAWYKIQKNKFASEAEFRKELYAERKKIESIIENNILGGKLSVVISKERKEEIVDYYNMETCSYIEEVRCIKLDEFAIWAKNVNCIKCPSIIIEKVFPKIEVSKKPKSKGGKPKGSLAEAVEYVYKKLLEKGKTDELEAGNAKTFLKNLQEMATEKNENHDEYVIERIELVKIPKNGQCSVKTKERKSNKPPYKTIEVSQAYTTNAISKQLTSLRKKFPLTP